ncbi:MAG: glycosyl hydrolase family 18 protein [Cytophagaceae bacterium]
MNIRLILVSFAISLGFTTHVSGQFKVVGYLPNWGNFSTNASQVDYSKITHLFIAFVNPSGSSADLSPTNGLSEVVTLAHTNNVKVFVSFGGGTVTNQYREYLKPENRAQLVQKFIDLAVNYNLDGLDCDLEGAAIDENYESFVTELKAGLVTHNKQLSAALALWTANKVSNTALAAFDFINLMAYDATGCWNPQNPGQHSPYEQAVNEINYWHITRGVAKEKIILGVPFYGYHFNNNNCNSVTYRNITASFPGSQNNDVVYPQGGGTIFYNGIPTIKSKTNLAWESAGGIMIWELTQDATGANSLLSAIDEVIKHVDTNIPPQVHLSIENRSYNEEEYISIAGTATDEDGSIYKVMFYADDIVIHQSFAAPYEFEWHGSAPGTYIIKAMAIDNIGASKTSEPVSVTITAAESQKAYRGTPWLIPGVIESEDFDYGGSGVSFIDNTPTNSGKAYRLGPVDIEACTDFGGGFNIGWTDTGEWLEYTVNIEKDGIYNLKIRVASFVNNSKISVLMDGTTITGTLTVPNTGGWQKWQTIDVTDLNLTAGLHILRVNVVTSGFNLNYLQFEEKPATGLTKNKSLSTALFYPNPCNEQAFLKFSLTDAGKTEIQLIDFFGRKVFEGLNVHLSQGDHICEFNTSDLQEGIYYCKIMTENYAPEIIKIKVMK